MLVSKEAKSPSFFTFSVVNGPFLAIKLANLKYSAGLLRTFPAVFFRQLPLLVLVTAVGTNKNLKKDPTYLYIPSVFVFFIFYTFFFEGQVQFAIFTISTFITIKEVFIEI